MAEEGRDVPGLAPSQPVAVGGGLAEGTVDDELSGGADDPWAAVRSLGPPEVPGQEQPLAAGGGRDLGGVALPGQVSDRQAAVPPGGSREEVDRTRRQKLVVGCADVVRVDGHPDARMDLVGDSGLEFHP